MKWKRVVIAIFSIIIAAFGVQIIVLANEGFDSISTLVLGLMHYTPLTFGQWSMIISFLFLIITFFVHREKIGIASLLYVIFLGGTLQVTERFTQGIHFGQYSLLFSLLGFFLYAFGIAGYLHMNLGAGPNEGIMFILVTKLKLRIRTARICLDLVINLLGFLMGAQVGIGTLFGIFCLGPLIDWFLKCLAKRSLYDGVK